MKTRSMLTRRVLAFIALAFLAPAASQAAPAQASPFGEQRTALVIGNGGYESSPLKNPVNDASDVAVALQKAGFSVVLKKNANLQAMEEAIEGFGHRLKRGGVGLFFFAGHAIQVNGVNYLIPIGARINKESDAKYKAIDIGRVLDEMSYANNGLNMVILDACRDNPFGRGFRSAGRGLAVVSAAPTGTFIAYSTGPGQVAQDGEGRNSPFTEALLESMSIPALPLEQVFKRVRQKLDAVTGSRQIPWELSSFKGDFFFTPASGPAVASATPLPAPAPAGPAAAVLKDAQLAYDAGRFAEPEGDNAIELSRRALRIEPGNAGAGELIARAATAYENRAKLALAGQDRGTALKIYQRLFKLFPEQEAYLKQTVALGKPAVPDIAGAWKWSVRSPFVPDRTNRISGDGSCRLDNMAGTWTHRKEGNEERFTFYWSDTWTHKMTLSKDGLMMIGTDDWGTRVTGIKTR